MEPPAAKPQTPLAIYLTGALLSLVGFGLVLALALFPSRAAPNPTSARANPSSTPSSRASARPSPSLAAAPAPSRAPLLPSPSPSPSPSSSPLRWSESTPIELGPSWASTPSELGPSREDPLPTPTWGRYLRGDPGYQVEPPSLDLDGPSAAPPPLEPSEVSRAYAEGLGRLRRGKDGIELLERAADAGHVEAAFLCWLWRPKSETSARLVKLLGPETRERLVRSFRSGIPQALWVPVSSRWLRQFAEAHARALTSGDLERVRRALPSSMSQEDRERMLDLYVRRRPPNLQISVERVDEPTVRSQVPRLEEGKLILLTEVSVVIGTRTTYTNGVEREELPGVRETQLELALPLEPQ